MNIPFEYLWAIALAFALIAFYFYLLSKKQYRQNAELAEQNQRLQSELESLKQQKSTLQEAIEHSRNDLQAMMQQSSELHAIKGKFEQLQLQYQSQSASLENSQSTVHSLQEKLQACGKEVVELSKTLDSERQMAEEKIELLANAKKQLTDEFKLLANQIFEQKQNQFNETSKASMESVLKPMQGVLDEFKKRVEHVHKEDIEGRASLSEQLKQLQALNAQMTTEAHNLTQALKGDSKTQGNWGELILQRLLERSGLSEGIEFEREKSFNTESGKRLRPDVIINLPDKKHVVIDSKVSLTHYEQALNSDDQKVRQRAVDAHLLSLKKHIATLADKRYEHLDQLNAPDFVLMFIPVEGAYLMAIEEDSGIFEDAFEKRVAVVTPTTLFTTLKTIEQLWRYERQSENTVKLIKRAAEVHDKFVGFVETFEKVGTQFDTAQNSYIKAKKQLIAGNGNLIRQAEMLKTLAGKTKKELPDHLLQEAEGAKLVENE